MASIQTSTITEPLQRNLNLSSHGGKDVYAEFGYYLPPSGGRSEPSTNDLELIQGTKDQDTRRLLVLDIRGRGNEFDLDKNGFRYVNLHSEIENWHDDDHIKEVYYPELEEMLRREL